jgi:hypothetical protein
VSQRFALCIWLRILPQLPQLLPAHSLKSDHHGVRAPVTHSCRYLQALHLRASVIINMQSSWNRFRNRNSVLIPNSLSLYTCFTCMLILRRLLRRTVCRQIIGGSLWGSNCASALEKSLCAYWRVNGAVQLIFGGFKSVIKLSWARYGPKDTQDWKWRQTSAKLLLWRLVNEFSFNLQDTGSNWPEWQLAM